MGVQAVMTLSERWQKLREGYVYPNEDENSNDASYVDWQARFHASKVILSELGLDEDSIHGVVHNAVSWGCDDFAGLIANIRDERFFPVVPDKPVKRISYHSEPKPKFEERAREIFESQFRKAYPGERINSKLAKGKWTEVESKALELARQEYFAAKEKFLAHGSKIDKSHAEKMKEWQKRVDLVTRLSEILDKCDGQMNY